MNLKQVKEAIEESKYQETQLDETYIGTQAQDHRNLDQYINFIENNAENYSYAFSEALKNNENQNEKGND